MGMIEKAKNFLYRNYNLEVEVIDEVGRRTKHYVTPVNNTFRLKFEDGEQDYIVDHNFLILDQKKKILVGYYHKNNPQPIHMEHKRNPDLDGRGFREIMESKVVKDLFSEEGMNILMWILFILIFVGVLLVWQLAISNHWVKPAKDAASIIGLGGYQLWAKRKKQ